MPDHQGDNAAMPQLYLATLADAAELARFAESTFRDTFAAANTPEHMAQHCRDNYATAIQAAQITDPAWTTLLIRQQETLIAYAQCRSGDAPACVASARPGEIHRLYVHRNWHGRGIARMLMSACIETLRQRDADMAWLGVWEQNPRAAAFYRKSGFVEVGEHVFTLGGDPQRDVVMARALTREPASAIG